MAVHITTCNILRILLDADTSARRSLSHHVPTGHCMGHLLLLYMVLIYTGGQTQRFRLWYPSSPFTVLSLRVKRTAAAAGHIDLGQHLVLCVMVLLVAMLLYSDQNMIRFL
jgi:hypothetical protein